MGNYYVYILASESRVLYTGMTNDLIRRLSEHKLKLTPGFTKKYNVTKLVYYERHSTAGEAITREKSLKGWLRSKKMELIQQENPDWRDLSIEWEEFRA